MTLQKRRSEFKAALKSAPKEGWIYSHCIDRTEEKCSNIPRAAKEVYRQKQNKWIARNRIVY